MDSSFHLPELVAHADWGSSARKRQAAVALLGQDQKYILHPPSPVSDPRAWITQLERQIHKKGSVLIGFDFPIGLPLAFARTAGIKDYLSILPQFGEGEWAEFYNPANSPEQISLHRPFYPARPGGSKREFLVNRLGLESFSELHRVCEQGQPISPYSRGRRAACPLFWTLGGQQVGKAAISGWRDVLAPEIRKSKNKTSFWPFSGRLENLLITERLIVVETYPAEFYSQLGITFSKRQIGAKTGKRSQNDRKSNSATLLGWIEKLTITCPPDLSSIIQNGFGESSDGEDAFDAVVGLIGMLYILLGNRTLFEPENEQIRRIEGWIFGQSI